MRASRKLRDQSVAPDYNRHSISSVRERRFGDAGATESRCGPGLPCIGGAGRTINSFNSELTKLRRRDP